MLSSRFTQKTPLDSCVPLSNILLGVVSDAIALSVLIPVISKMFDDDTCMNRDLLVHSNINIVSLILVDACTI